MLIKNTINIVAVWLILTSWTCKPIISMTLSQTGTLKKLSRMPREKLIACKVCWIALITHNQLLTLIRNLRASIKLWWPLHPKCLLGLHWTLSSKKLWLRLTLSKITKVLIQVTLWPPLALRPLSQGLDLSLPTRKPSPKLFSRRLPNRSLRKQRKMPLRLRMPFLLSSRELLWPKKKLRRLRSNLISQSLRELLKRRQRQKRRREKDSLLLLKPRQRPKKLQELLLPRKSKRKKC